MTRGEAESLCGIIPAVAYTRDAGYGRTAVEGFAATLRERFPGFNWRVIPDRSGERTRWALTVDDDDPREHYFDRLGGACVHCGKTARELSLGHDDSNTDYEELVDALSERP